MALDDHDKKSKKLYMFGGVNKNGHDQNWLYQLSLNDIESGWTKIHGSINDDSNYPSARHSFGCQMVYFDKNKEAHSSYSYSYNYKQDVRYNSETSTGSISNTNTNSNSNSGRSWQFVIFGGRWRNSTIKNKHVYKYYNDIWAFDVTTHDWKVIEENRISNIEARAGVSIMKLGTNNDNIVIVGGKNDTYVSNKVWKYDFNHMKWKELAPLPNSQKRYEAAASVSKDGKTGYLFGGQSNIQYLGKDTGKVTLTNSILKYDVYSNKWKKLQNKNCYKGQVCPV